MSDVRTISLHPLSYIRSSCFRCRKPFKLKNAIDLPPNMDETQYGQEMTQRDDCYASKAKELVRLIKITGNQRSLVFSQWTSHLQHLEGKRGVKIRLSNRLTSS